MSKAKILRLVLLALGCALVWVPAAIPADPAARPAIVCTLAPGQTSLLPGARHGLAAHLRQYPDLSLATGAQKARAQTLLERARAATKRWQNVKAAQAERLQHEARQARAGRRRDRLPPRRASPLQRRSAPRRRQASGVAHLRDAAGGAPGADRRHVQRSARRARADACRPDRALALPPRVHEGRQARPRTGRRPLPQRLAAGAGERDAAPLVHARPAERVRGARAGGRALPRRGADPGRPAAPARTATRCSHAGGRASDREPSSAVPILAGCSTNASFGSGRARS